MDSHQNELTLPKYLSRTSTYRCIISNVTSSLSDDPIPQTKNKDAYRRYTTLVSVWSYQTKLYRYGSRIPVSDCKICSQAASHPPLYSRKLHILVRRARTNCVTSFTIFALALGGIVVNHFARRTLPIGCAFTGRI
jgi:hypothetical protein